MIVQNSSGPVISVKETFGSYLQCEWFFIKMR